MTQAIATKKPPYLLMYIVTLVYLVVTAFFEEGVAYFDPVYTTLMSSTEFYLTFSLCAVLFLTVIYIAKHYFGIRINWVFFSLVVLLFLIDVVAIVSFPEWTVLTGVYHVTSSLRLRYITFWLAACMAFYVFFAIMPKSVRDVNDWNFYFFGGIIIAFSACIYSYFFEWAKYKSFFDYSQVFQLYDAPTSFTNNRNTFGTLLLIGVFSSFYLFKQSNRKLFIFVGVFFFLNIILTMSKTSIFSAALFIAVFSVFYCISTFRVHFLLKLSILLLVVFCFAFPFLVKPLGLADKNPLLQKISAYIANFFNPNFYFYKDSFDLRTDIWSSIFLRTFENPLRAFFGVGDWNFGWFLGFCTDGSHAYIESAHSGLFDVLGRNGLLGCAFYFALLGYFLYVYIKTKGEKKTNFILLEILVFSLAHGFLEDTNVLNMQTKSMMLLFMSFMPLLTRYYLKKENYCSWEKEYANSSAGSSKVNFGALQKSIVCLTVLLPFEAIIIGLSDYFYLWHGASTFGSIFFQIDIALLFIVFPFALFSLLSLKKCARNFYYYLILSSTCVWVFSCLISLLFANNFIFCLILTILGCVISIFSCVKLPKKDCCAFVKKFLLFASILIILVVTGKLVVNFALVSDEIYQPYAAMCLIILDFIVPFLIIVASPFHKLMLGEFDIYWQHIEDIYRFAGYHYKVKSEIRLMKATQRKPVLRNQK
jgi:hypothetical protein